MMSQLLDSAVFPGVQGGPLEHMLLLLKRLHSKKPFLMST